MTYQEFVFLHKINNVAYLNVGSCMKHATVYNGYVEQATSRQDVFSFPTNYQDSKLLSNVQLTKLAL